MQIVILCGGGGTRLWPVSTSSQPKQLTSIITEETLLERIYRVLKNKFSDDSIWIATNAKYVETISNLLPSVDSSHIIPEPEKRDSLGAFIAHTAVVASKTSPDEAIVFVPCDDYFPEEDFETYLLGQVAIGNALEQGRFELVTAVVKPTFPSTGLGYVQFDDDNVQDNVAPVLRFREKPDQETAQQFIADGDTWWHKCNISFTYNSLLSILRKYSPELVSTTEQVYADSEIKPEVYSQFPINSFEHAVMEKVESIGAVLLPITWDDLGTWKVVYDKLPNIENNTHTVQVDGEGNKQLTKSGKKVAFVGVSNLLVVESEDGILVVDPSKAGGVKQAVNTLNGK